MKKKFISVPSQYSNSTVLDADDTKIPVEILVMHSKKNLNKSNFEIESIENAKESIKNIPILAYIKKIDGSDKKDFAGHEIELTIKDGDLKITYLERPIGVIPESNNYEYVEVDGKTYVKVTGYIWKEYLNDGYEILQENPNKSVSMEITVDDYSVGKDGVIDIKAYRYLGVTVLGDNVGAGMEGANMQVIGQFSENFSNDFYEKVELLNKELKDRFELEFNQNSNKGGDLGELNKDKEDKNMSKELSFSATYKQKREALQNACDPIIVMDDNNEKCISETHFWIEDFTDEYVMVEKYYWDANGSECTYGRFAYTFDEGTFTATLTSEFEKMIKVWLTEEEYQKLEDDRKVTETMTENYENMKTELDDCKTKMSELETEKETLSTKVTLLQEYQDKNETKIKQEKVDDIISNFEEVLSGNEKYEEIKEKAMEYDLEDLEEKLYALKGRIEDVKANKTSKKQEFSSRVSILDDDTNKKDSYYGKAVEYIK